MSEKNINIFRQGMSFANPSTLKEGQFSIMVNGVLQSVNDTFLIATNENSNLLATRLKEGFKVIGTLVVPSLSLTFLFLVNPTTHESEIGFIYNTSSPDKPDTFSNQCCDEILLDPTPLEETDQIPLISYNTFVNAKCLNFNIDYPISSWIKIDDCNIRIYFNDFYNKPRYIDYKNFPKVNLSNCPLIETNDLDCDKILVFPETCYPKIEAVDIASGGQLTSGVYQFAICYSDVNSNKLTDYYYVTNPIPLFGRAITIDEEYPMSKSIKLEITNLNIDFRYFNLAVIKTIKGVSSAYLVETFDIKSDRFTYTYSGVEANIVTDISIDEILSKAPYYNKAKQTTEFQGYSMMYNLEEDRILNLQPVVSEIPIRYQTVEMNDGDYANPVIAQNYVGYLGDEVYAFGISFTKTNGKHTNVFPFVGRLATEFDLEEIDNKDVISGSVCNTTDTLNKRWQVYNTASTPNPVICIETEETSTPPIEIVDEVDCYSENILIVSIDTEYVNDPTPIFAYYPSFVPGSHYIGTNPTTGLPYNYPPQSKEDVINLTNYLSSNIISNINDYYQNDMCDCNIYLPNYPAGATVVPEFANPIQNVEDPNSSVEIVRSESVYTINQYSPFTLEAPDASKYPYVPNPCKNYANPDKDEEKGYVGWLENKNNYTALTAEIIPQSSTQNCGLETWGAFLADDVNNNENWYNVTCTNQDGVIGILFSTDNSTATLELYEALTNGTQGVQKFPTAPAPTGHGYYLFEGLTQGKAYLIKIKGNTMTQPPPNCNSGCCKELSFKICVVTPPPSQSTKVVVPGVAKLVKTCLITYFGQPVNSCKPQAHEYGDFAYWESTETYPCNEEVWGNLSGKPIRHFKFPEHKQTPFFKKSGSIPNLLSKKANKIYPKGIAIDVNDVKLALNKAVSDGLITFEEQQQICGYRIYRGNRRGNESIIGKGLLRDVWNYKDNIYNTGNKILFPNFPFNDLRDNEFIYQKKINTVANLNQVGLQHPYSGDNYKNDKYVFDAPNLSFNNPGLGTELKLECEQFGTSVGSYNELKNNTKYQYIGAGVISAAIGFASVEAAFEALNSMVNATLTIPITVIGSGTSIPLGLILALVGQNIVSPIRMYSHYAEWYEIIKKFAPYRNYGLTYTAVGKYVDYTPDGISSVQEDNIRRQIANSQYLKPGFLNVKTKTGSIYFNNFKRESSVFIELNKDTFNRTATEDKSRVSPDCFNRIGVTGDICSYYASMKNYLPDQYGQIDSIEWLDTGYNGTIEWDNPQQNTLCDTIFGGDTYITRFTKKIKIPMFLDDRVIPSTSTQVNLLNQDIQMSSLPNVGYPRYFMDYPTTLDYNGATQALFGDVAVQSISKVDYNFICASSSGQAWADAGLASAIIGSFAGVAFGVISLPIAVGVISTSVKRDLGNQVFLAGKYIHAFYGLQDFLVESNYNLEFRHGENEKEKNFYPNVGDINEWTQEYNIPIYEDNYYYYNKDYSKQNRENPNFVLNNNFKQVVEDCKVSHPNRLIYSLQDIDLNSNYDGNLVYLANNYYEFPKSYGKLILVKGLSNGRVLGIQEDGYTLLNAYISQETNIGISTVGSNSLFNRNIPAQMLKTDLGFAGTQTPTYLSTEYGGFWVDNKRAQIIQFAESAQDIIKEEEKWWFKENLPFKILNDFPDFDITNNFKYIGMSMVYDTRYNRIIITKRDVQLKPEYRGTVTYDGNVFKYKDETFIVSNDKYFCDKSWTISYSPMLKSFTSFHTYTPNYYIPNINYFSSGINYSLDDNTNKEGIWHHNLTNQSYQVFYGELEPYILEYTLPSKFRNRQIEFVDYTTEFYRFQDNISYGLVPNITFNKAVIYNQKQTSGLLELIPKEKNNLFQNYQYISGKQNQNSRTILVDYIERSWTFNNFYDVAVENSRQPLMSYQCDNIAYKEINDKAISYANQYFKKPLLSDYHVIRLINDKYSNYQIVNRYSLTNTNNTNT